MNIELADLSIVGTLAPRDRYGIRRTRHELQLHDGSLHWLHLVLDDGAPAKFLRGVQLEDKRTFALIDLRRANKQLTEDLLTCADRDVPGLVKFALRDVAPDRQAFAGLVRECAAVIGIPQVARAPA